MRDSDQDILRAYAIRGLGELGDKKDWDTAARWISHGASPDARVAAVDTLLKLSAGREQQTGAKLVALLADPSLFVQQRAINALADGNFQGARTALMNAAQSANDSRVRQSARSALERLSTTALEAPRKSKTPAADPGMTLRNIPRQEPAIVALSQ